MPIIGKDKICGEIADALGIKNCRRLDLHMAVDDAVTVTAEYYPEGEELKRVAAILKNYKLELVETE